MWGWKCIEADFQRHYGIDLSRELPNMPFRKFMLLAERLPQDSSIAVFRDERNKYFLAELG